MKLKNYISKRTEANYYNKLCRIGFNCEMSIDKMRKARILKPSELQIEEIIEDTKRMQSLLLQLESKEDFRAFIETISKLDKEKIEERFKKLKELEINSLTQCKEIYKLASIIGRAGTHKNGILYEPLFMYFTLLESFVIITLMFIVLKIFI